jgi:ABC-type branched-subunit amino acid transport system substrate-binding protein
VHVSCPARTRRAVGAGLVAAALTASACSVSAPRHGALLTTAGSRSGDGDAGVGAGRGGDQGLAAGSASSGSGSASGSGSGSAVGGATTGAGASTGTGGGGSGSALPASGTGSTGGSGGSGATTSGSTTAGTSGPTEVGVTPSSVTISFLGGFSGTVGELSRQVATGFKTWADDVNAHGGIYGRKIVIKMVDHQDTPLGGVAACKESLTNGSFVPILGIGGDFDIPDCFDKAKVPNLYLYSAEPLYRNWHYSFSMLTHLDDSGRTTATFIKNRLHHPDAKVGVFCLNQVTSKYSCDAFLAEAKRQNLSVVDTEYVEPNQAQFTSELIRMRNRGANHVALFVTLESVGVLRDANALNYHPAWTMGVFALDFLTQAGRNLFTGVTGLRNGATVDTPRYQEYLRKAQQYNDTSADPGDTYIVYGEGLVMGEALQAAGPVLTRATFLKGLETVTHFDDQVTPPISWASDHAGTHASFPAVCCSADWTWKGLGPAATAF